MIPFCNLNECGCLQRTDPCLKKKLFTFFNFVKKINFKKLCVGGLVCAGTGYPPGAGAQAVMKCLMWGLGTKSIASLYMLLTFEKHELLNLCGMPRYMWRPEDSLCELVYLLSLYRSWGRTGSLGLVAGALPSQTSCQPPRFLIYKGSVLV